MLHQDYWCCQFPYRSFVGFYHRLASIGGLCYKQTCSNRIERVQRSESLTQSSIDPWYRDSPVTDLAMSSDRLIEVASSLRECLDYSKITALPSSLCLTTTRWVAEYRWRSPLKEQRIESELSFCDIKDLSITCTATCGRNNVEHATTFRKLPSTRFAAVDVSWWGASSAFQREKNETCSSDALAHEWQETRKRKSVCLLLGTDVSSALWNAGGAAGCCWNAENAFWLLLKKELLAVVVACAIGDASENRSSVNNCCCCWTGALDVAYWPLDECCCEKKSVSPKPLPLDAVVGALGGNAFGDEESLF